MLKLCFNNIEVVNDFNILLCNILACKSLPTFMSKTVVRAITYNHYDAIGTSPPVAESKRLAGSKYHFSEYLKERYGCFPTANLPHRCEIYLHTVIFFFQ